MARKESELNSHRRVDNQVAALRARLEIFEPAPFPTP